MTPDISRPFYRAIKTLDALALIEEPPPAGAEGGSNSLQRWRRTQRIRTAAAIPVEVLIIDRAKMPVYLKIAEKARHLRNLGMSDRAGTGSQRQDDCKTSGFSRDTNHRNDDASS